MNIILINSIQFLKMIQGFSGLIPKNNLANQTIQPIHHKAEEQRKATELSLAYYQLINEFFQSYSQSLEKLISEYKEDDPGISFSSIMVSFMKSMEREILQLNQICQKSFQTMQSLNNKLFWDFSIQLNKIEELTKKYQQYEPILLELAKKYFRQHRNMLSNLAEYKCLLNDGNLVYNSQQKIKRYGNCQRNFKVLIKQHQLLIKRTEILSKVKLDLCQSSQEVIEEFFKVAKMIGAKVIGETKNFAISFCNSYKFIIKSLASTKFMLEKEEFFSVFKNVPDSSKKEYFSEKVEKKSNLPLFLEFHHLIKDQYLSNFNSELLSYHQEMQFQIEKRKKNTKRFHDFLTNYIKILEKQYIVKAKQIITFFEKVKKKLGQKFGNRLVSFLKSINLLFDFSIKINQKFLKNCPMKLQIAQSFINQEKKLLTNFGQQLKISIERFIGKKQLKKMKNPSLKTQENLYHQEDEKEKEQISNEAEKLKKLIENHEQKMKKNCDKIKKIYLQLIDQLNSTMSEFYPLCMECQQVYFGVDQFKIKYQKYQNDIDAILKNDETQFQKLPFNFLRKQKSQISFDGELSKVQEFRNMQNPLKEEESGNYENDNEIPSVIDQESAERLKEWINQKSKSLGEMSLRSLGNMSSSRESMVYDKKQLKNLDFLLSKTKFKENQHLIKTFSCALRDKIVLQGKIYITTNRICFYSTFNSSNVFLRGTFINFPKEDINKIEKKANGLIDNSISFSTVKGEVFFTSFFSRNQAYEVIVKNYGIKGSVAEENKEVQNQQFEEQDQMEGIIQEDDLNEGKIGERSAQIQKIIPKFPYVEAAKLEINRKGFNALKIFKLFYGESEITIKNKVYPNFMAYSKQEDQNTNVEISTWEPALSLILNKCNIKNSAPLKSCRKIKATVPVKVTGIPFMPKTGKSQENQTLYFYSKDKWQIYNHVASTGIPYTDTFNVQTRTLCQSNQNGEVLLLIESHINFIKDSMMKSIVQSKTQAQTKILSKKWINEIEHYLKTMKNPNKRKIKNGKNLSIKQLQEQLEIKNNQIATLEKQKQDLKSVMFEKIENLKNQKKKRESVILFQAALLIILFAIIMI